MVSKYQFGEQVGQISNGNHHLMSLMLNFNLGILCFSYYCFSLPHLMFPLFFDLHHSHSWSERATKRGSKPWTKAGAAASETVTETLKCCLWLPAHITPSIAGSPDQGSPSSCLLSIWWCTDIKEDGRNYLSSPGWAHRTVEESLISQLPLLPYPVPAS